MFRILLLCAHVVHSVFVTNEIHNNYNIKTYLTDYDIKTISYDITQVAKNINDVINEFYSKSIINRIGLKEIIIIEKITTKTDKKEYINGLFIEPNTIIIKVTNNKFNKSTLHHEIMHMIDYLTGYSYSYEWDLLNKFDYDENYDATSPIKEGFVTNYSEKNRFEDIATTYEEFVCMTYSNGKGNKNVKYDKILISKFKLLFKKLINFHGDFKKIITERNIETNSSYPDINFEKDNGTFIFLVVMSTILIIAQILSVNKLI